MINTKNGLTLKMGPKKIRAHTNEIPHPTYKINSTYFAIAYELEDNVVTNNCIFTKCRDVLTNAIKENYLRKKMDYSATKVLLFKYDSDDILHRRALMAKKLLNSIEKKNKWVRSKVYRITKVVNHPDIELNSCAQFEYIVGSRCWIRNIYFFYAYIQILRAFIQKGDALKGVDTLDKFAATVGHHGEEQISHNVGIERWEKLFQKRLSIFKGVSVDSMYRVHDCDGIERLCSGNSSIPEVRKRFAKVIGTS